MDLVQYIGHNQVPDHPSAVNIIFAGITLSITLPGHKYLYRPKFPLIYLRIYLLPYQLISQDL